MKSLSRIEKSAFKRGEYVGYANGAWRIMRYGNQWRAWCRLHADSVVLYADTLAEMDRLLEAESLKQQPYFQPISY